jgi:hypothetical protein
MLLTDDVLVVVVTATSELSFAPTSAGLFAAVTAARGDEGHAGEPCLGDDAKESGRGDPSQSGRLKLEGLRIMRVARMPTKGVTAAASAEPWLLPLLAPGVGLLLRPGLPGEFGRDVSSSCVVCSAVDREDEPASLELLPNASAPCVPSTSAPLCAAASAELAPALRFMGDLTR